MNGEDGKAQQSRYRIALQADGGKILSESEATQSVIIKTGARALHREGWPQGTYPLPRIPRQDQVLRRVSGIRRI